MLFAGAYWETTPVAQWDEIQLRRFFVESPWAQPLRPDRSPEQITDVHAYLASAAPMREAEAELRRRTKPREDVLWDEYRAWMEENAATHIVLAVRLPKNSMLEDPRESRAMEQDSRLHAGRKKLKPTVVFSPTATDPYVRLAFPRAVKPGDEEFEIELYLPGASGSYRTAVFKTKDLLWKGKPEM